MANFWDLPKPVRERIYRLHLVKDKPFTRAKHEKYATSKQYQGRARNTKWIPPICALSKKADREAAPIYFGENHFVFGRLQNGGKSNVVRFACATWPRHLRMIRKVTIQWPEPEEVYESMNGVAREAFLEICRMTGLQELYVRVDEREMMTKMLRGREYRETRYIASPSRQQNLPVLRYPGMTTLLKLHDIQHVEFLESFDHYGSEIGGPIPGGILETEVAPRLMGSRLKRPEKGSCDTFAFLDLPPELRNIVYGLLLCVEGPVHPSSKPPSSAPKKCSANGQLPVPGSALNILGVNKQIHDEAVSIFYDSNEFVFYYPTQMSAFILSLGRMRQRSIRKLTLQYTNGKAGGVDLASITFPTLKLLKGLRQLQIVLGATLSARIYSQYRPGGNVWTTHLCNPCSLPGMKTLFELRNITNIKLRDTLLEDKVAVLGKKYPDGVPANSEGEAFMRLACILDHFNAALADAQKGRVNREILNDGEWHMRDELPVLLPVVEKAIKVEEPSAEPAADGPPADEDGQAVEANTLAVTTVSSDGMRNRDIRDWFRPKSQLARAAPLTAADVKTDPSDDASEAADGSAQYVGHGAEEDDEDTIVVKHVVRPAYAAAAARIGGLDGADEGDAQDQDEDEDMEDSYADREPSVEL